MATAETTRAFRLSLFRLEALVDSNSCLAAKRVIRSLSEDFPTGDLLKVVQLPLIGVLREFTKLL
jgi:hypothetical protein